MTADRQAVIFDMDGTLLRPMLDFDAIKREIGIDGLILETIQAMPAAERARAEAILHRHEAEAAARSELQPGAAEVVTTLRQRGLPVALMTRNSRRSVEVFHQRHGLSFDLVWTRESGAMKPSPEPVRAICRALCVQTSATWTVGDFHFDILCGAAAGAVTVLLLDPDAERPAWADEADHVIHQLGELLELIPSGLPPRHRPGKASDPC